MGLGFHPAIKQHCSPALFFFFFFFFAHMQRKKVTQKESAHNRGPSCGRSDLEVRTQTAASLFTLFSCVFHSPPLLPSPSSFSHDNTELFWAPKDKEQNLQEEHSESVVLLYDAEQHPLWLGTQRSGHTPPPTAPSPLGYSVPVCAYVFHCVRVYAWCIVILESVRWHLHVCSPWGG